MDGLDLFFKKYVYKFPKGYPDMNNEQDINLLADLLEGIGINLNEVKMLQASELKKRENIKTFLDKFYNKKPFETIDGNVILNKIKIIQDIYTPEDNNVKKNGLYNQIVSSSKLTIYIEGKYENGTEFKGTSGKLIKTEEFGGQSKNFVSKETQALNKGNEEIKNYTNNNQTIDIQVDKIISKNCTGLLKQPGTPKADFITNGQPTIYISHKDGTSAGDFYRWGGISYYKDDEEVKSFIEAVRQKITNNEFQPNQSFYKKIINENLKKKIVYGKDFSGKFGKNNVNCIIQGDIKFIPSKTNKTNLYTLNGAKIWLNGQVPQEDYEPVLFATYRNYRNDFKIKNSEILSIPLARAKQSAIEISST
jgi:hypothetical protein